MDAARTIPIQTATLEGDGMGCHAGGEKLLAAGQGNDALYVILSGTLSVHVPGTQRAHVTLKQGECVGELSLIDGFQVSADVFADEATVVVIVEQIGRAHV